MLFASGNGPLVPRDCDVSFRKRPFLAWTSQNCRSRSCNIQNSLGSLARCVLIALDCFSVGGPSTLTDTPGTTLPRPDGDPWKTYRWFSGGAIDWRFFTADALPMPSIP